MSSKERLKILYNFYDNEQNDSMIYEQVVDSMSYEQVVDSMSYEQVVDNKYKNDITFFSKIEQLPEDQLIQSIFKKKTKKFNILEATNRFLEQQKKDDIIYKKKSKKRKLK